MAHFLDDAALFQTHATARGLGPVTLLLAADLERAPGRKVLAQADFDLGHCGVVEAEGIQRQIGHAAADSGVGQLRGGNRRLVEGGATRGEPGNGRIGRGEREFDDFVERARALRHDPCVGPAGANVHFVDRSTTPWRIRSFERGIEDETLACGSGCVSAVEALGDGATALRTALGSIIAVDPTRDRWTLEGPAVLVFETEWRR